MPATDPRRLMASLRAGPAADWAEAVRVGFHESAHAVAFTLEGRGVDAVALTLAGAPEGAYATGGGRLQAVGGWCRSRIGPETVFALVAGRTAEALAGCASPSFSEAMASADYTAARAIDPTFDPFTAAEAAQRRLRPCWVAICRLAEVLLERGELDGLEAEQIVRANLPTHVRDEYRLWGPVPDREPEPGEIEAEALRQHFWRYGHTRLDDDRSVEALPDAEYGAVLSPWVSAADGAARDARLDELEDIFPDDRTAVQSSLLELLLLVRQVKQE